ncbi:glutaredoxin-like protein [Seal parapoxvirus]|uniref:Glutaredoxin-2 n=1 Tax=Seal parapoxvirus TaxID=187984 RepID=A0A1Z3GCW2_9POXV|nr:glutaredoxin-like protein [Seal parapoxvirus]ASC55598.1 glutaredoxin-like protein [Seal parapoxvirus]
MTTDAAAGAKPTLILLGKPLCSVCDVTSRMMERLEGEFDVKRVNILSLFSKEGAVSVLGMGVYKLITEITEYFGNEYVLLLKYDAASKSMAAVDIRKFVVVAQIDEKKVDIDQLRAAIMSARFNAWPVIAPSSSVSLRR